MTLQMYTATKTSLGVYRVLKTIPRGVQAFVFKGRVSYIPDWPGISCVAGDELELLCLLPPPPKYGIKGMGKYSCLCRY